MPLNTLLLSGKGLGNQLSVFAIVEFSSQLFFCHLFSDGGGIRVLTDWNLMILLWCNIWDDFFVLILEFDENCWQRPIINGRSVSNRGVMHDYWGLANNQFTTRFGPSNCFTDAQSTNSISYFYDDAFKVELASMIQSELKIMKLLEYFWWWLEFE